MTILNNEIPLIQKLSWALILFVVIFTSSSHTVANTTVRSKATIEANIAALEQADWRFYTINPTREGYFMLYCTTVGLSFKKCITILRSDLQDTQVTTIQ